MVLSKKSDNILRKSESGDILARDFKFEQDKESVRFNKLQNEDAFEIFFFKTYSHLQFVNSSYK